METKEIWKDISGYEGKYMVSNMGNVKSLYRTVKVTETKSRRVNEKILSKKTDKYGYNSTTLSNCGLRSIATHRLVAMAFIPNSKNKPQVNHKNGVKTDNRVENLEWNTNSENIKHAFRKGLKSQLGSKNNQSKLHEKDVLKIRKLSNLRSKEELASEFNVSTICIEDIISKRRWKHI